MCDPIQMPSINNRIKNLKLIGTRATVISDNL